VVQARSGWGHGQPLPAPSVAFPGAGARYLDHAKGNCLKHISSVAGQESQLSQILGGPQKECCRGATSGRRHDGEQQCHRGRTLCAPEVRLASRLVFEHTRVSADQPYLSRPRHVWFISSPTTARPSQGHLNRIWRINRSSLKVSVRRIVHGDDMEKGLSARRVSPFRKEKP
jgi:hypothetical protein